MAKNSTFYSSGSINKKIVIVLAIILVAIASVVTTVVVKKNSSKNEEVLSSDSLKDVSNSIASDNDKTQNKKENENKNENQNQNVTNTEDKVVNNETKNTDGNENIQISNSYVPNTNIQNKINTNNKNKVFVQKVLEDVVYDREYVNDETNWNIKDINMTSKIENIDVLTSEADLVAPSIFASFNSTGDIFRKIYSKIGFMLFDNYAVAAYKLNDDEYTNVDPSKEINLAFDDIKDSLVYGKNTITVKDISGNESTYEFIFDDKAPTITVKDGFVGNKDKNVYSNVSFRLYDDYELLAYKINNGNYMYLWPTKWLDANFQNIRSQFVYGKNTISVRDRAGNKSTYEFIYDNIAPEISVKDDFVGNKDKKIYSNVSFKLYDEYEIASYKINNNSTIKVTPEQNVDVTFDEIKDSLVYGTNTITVKDVAGNTSTYQFIYDNKAPDITVTTYVGSRSQNVFSNVNFMVYDRNKVEAYKINDGEFKNIYPSQISFINFTDIKDELVYGKNILYVRDRAGNIATYEFVYDNVAPTITVKDGFVGNKDKNVYSNVSFKLYDEYKVKAYKINDTEYVNVTPSEWSDANFDNIKSKLVYGINTITVKDVAGNESTYEFVYDNVAPTITVKDNFVGNKDKNVYSNVSFKLYDEYEVAAYKINDTEYVNVTPNKWSDANFDNIKSKLVYGKNTITLKDVAGNETTYEFVYDNVAPTITVKDGFVGNKDKNIYSNVSFKLYDEYEVEAYKINDTEYVNVTPNKWSDANFDNIKSKLVYGKNTITLKDVAGNETTFEFVYDNVGPTITVKDGFVGNKDKKVYSNVSFKLYDDNKVVAYKINDTAYVNITPSKWSDANFNNFKNKLVYGTNTITVKDIAGNETTYEFVYDNVKPTITVKDGFVGNKDKNIYSNVSFKLYDEYQVVAYKINDTAYVNITPSKWSDANFNNFKNKLVYGTNTITVKDIAGNEYTYEFKYDNIAPEVLEINYSETELTRNDVIVTIKVSEEVNPVAGWTMLDDNKTLTRTFTANTREELVLSDMAGNTVIANYIIENIDKDSPIATVEYSTVEPTNGNVTVTIRSNEEIKQVEGWELSTDKLSISKEFTENVNGNVNISDLIGNETTVSYEVTNIDKESPVISVSPLNITIQAGNNYDDAGVTVTDNLDQNILSRLVKTYTYTRNGTAEQVVASVDTSKVGTYTIKYNVTDNAGNSATEVIRTVEIYDTIPPVITLNGSAEEHVTFGRQYVDKGTTVTDNTSEELNATIEKITYYTYNIFQNKWNIKLWEAREVREWLIGRYEIVYTVTDSSGNTAKATRNVYVGV